MQIFRINPSHEKSAAYLDNRRLSKQVLELYQILRVNLSMIGLLETNTRYLHHPIVKHVYNDGHPFITHTFKLLIACDREHQRRGGKRSPGFRKDLDELASLIEAHEGDCLWNEDPLPPFYVYGDAKIYGEEAYSLYASLLHEKWQNDKIPPRCGIHLEG